MEGSQRSVVSSGQLSANGGTPRPAGMVRKKKVMVRKVRKVKKKKPVDGSDAGGEGSADSSTAKGGDSVLSAPTPEFNAFTQAENQVKREERGLQEALERAQAKAAEEELKREIEQMEKAIQLQKTESVASISSGVASKPGQKDPQAPNTTGTPRKRLVKRKVLVKKKKRPSVGGASTTSDATNSTAKTEEERLQEEIRRMEKAIASEQQGKPTPASFRSEERPNPVASNFCLPTNQSKPPLPGPARPNLMGAIASAAAKREERVGSTDVPDNTTTQQQQRPTQKAMPSPARPNLMGAIASAAAKREERVSTSGVAEPHERPPPKAAPARPNLMNAIASAAAKRTERNPLTAATEVVAVSTKKVPVAPPPRKWEAKKTTSETNEPPAVRPPRLDLMGAISAAATSREERLEETNGELIMQEHEPEVDEEEHAGPPQLSFALAEMVTKKAKEREERLAEGGEKKMTKLKEKEEYKKEFKDIFKEAASMGRLTRLEEKVVEAVATEKDPLGAWTSGGLLAIQWRSNHMAVIHEAAALGNQTKRKEKVVSNCLEEDELAYLEEDDSPGFNNSNGGNGKAGQGQLKIDKLLVNRKEENAAGLSMIVRPMVFYNDINDVKLPKKRPPKINPQKKLDEAKKEMEEKGEVFRPILNISKDVAEKAWERRMRLDRPGGVPKVQEACPCPYCLNPSPYQTHAYREKERKRVEEGYESPSSDDERRKAQEARRLARRKQTAKPPSSASIKSSQATTTSTDEKAPARVERPRPKIKPSKPSSSTPQTKRAEKEQTELATPAPKDPPPIASPVVDSGCACVIL